MPKTSSIQPKKMYEFETRHERAIFVEQETTADLEKIKLAFADDNNLDKVHCENLIGGISIPIGVAGPLKINFLNDLNKTFQKPIYIPIATSEGALVASTSRGAKAINLGGGANTICERVGTTRGPVFYTGSVFKSQEFRRWFETNANQIKQIAEAGSNHLKLQKYDFKINGAYCFIRFYFYTGDAMGMNMATIASQKIVNFIEEKTDVICPTVSGNYCVDKKPAWLNFINGRGFQVSSEVILTKDILEKVLKTGAQKFFDTWLSKCMIGSAMSGSLGFNAHFANIVAAMFAATGQDLAQVVEGSMGMTTCKIVDNENLYISVYLPAMMTATVGGGTKLNTQREALNIMGVKTSEELAVAIGSTVLAGEISLLASQSIHTLADAHKKLGR
jgi:hydroxymethylglutaryl-CoA reductase (NADPH)